MSQRKKRSKKKKKKKKTGRKTNSLYYAYIATKCYYLSDYAGSHSAVYLAYVHTYIFMSFHTITAAAAVQKLLPHLMWTDNGGVCLLSEFCIICKIFFL